MAQPLAPLAAVSTSLRAIRWKHPRKAYPSVIELGLARIAAALDKPRSAQWVALFADAPVPGKDRERRKRSDGATNVASVLSTMIAAADLQRGLVATPAGDIWQRKTWSDVDVLAFGPLVPGERSMRRTERAAAELETQGFIRSVPWRVSTPDGIRSVPGLKFVSDKLWKILGLWSAVCSERRRRKQRSAEERKAAIEAAIGGTVTQLPGRTKPGRGRVTPPPASAPARPPPAQAGPMPASDIAAEHMARLKKLLAN